MRVRHLEPGARAGWVPRLPRASHRACARRPRKGRQHVKCQLRGKKVSKYGKQLGQGGLTNKGAIDGCDMVTGIGLRQPRTSPAMPLSTVTIIAPLCLGLLESPNRRHHLVVGAEATLGLTRMVGAATAMAR